ncbi:MAG: hypothetical protein IPJ74_21690 [Saprospiraceae bacterium]|nr:hypothetical protein [Saprospiraceae bacterium]
MKSIYKLGLALLFFAGTASIVHANEEERREFTKTIKKEFDISKTGTTAIYNQFGKVEIKTWDRNRVKIDVTIIVNASSDSAAQKVFDRINISFYNKTDYVKAETQIEESKKDWWDWTTYVRNGNNQLEYSINYDVYLPPTNNVELSNKHGDAFVAALEGKVNVDIKYGNIKMQSVKNNARVVLAHGNGWVQSVQNMTGDLAYAKFVCSEVKDAEIVSKYSVIRLDKALNILSNSKNDTYEVEQVNEFRNEGKYDNFNIGVVHDVIVNSKYTQVNVGKLNNVLDLNLGYGGASVITVGKDFTSVNLVGSHADFRVGFAPEASFKMDASANNANIQYPSDMNVTYEKDKGSSHEVQGNRGGQGTRGTITARLNYGGLKVKQE